MTVAIFHCGPSSMLASALVVDRWGLESHFLSFP